MDLQNSQLRPQKEKNWRQKIGTKNNGNKKNIVMNMVDINPSLSIIPLSINDLNIPTNRQRLSVDQKNVSELQENYFKYKMHVD